jgi:hypothetical protein
MPNVRALVRQGSLHRLFIKSSRKLRRDHNSRPQQTHGDDSEYARRVTQRPRCTHYRARADDGEGHSRNEDQPADVAWHWIGLR